MPTRDSSDDAERARAFWIGLDPHVLDVTLRAPFAPASGLGLPERVLDSGATPAAQVYAAIAATLGDDGAPVGRDGALDTDTLRGVISWLGLPEDLARSETGLMIIAHVRGAAEAAGLIARRSGRAHLMPLGGAADRPARGAGGGARRVR